jgi:hypothetical protein
MKTCLLLVSIIVTFTSILKGQEFIQPFEESIPPSANCYVIKLNGEKIEGKMIFGVSGPRGLTSIKIATSKGETIRLTAKEMKAVAFRSNKLTTAVAVLNRTESIKKASQTDWREIFDRDYIVYEQVLLPSGKKYAMMQLLNPGFDSKIRVYYSVGSSKTTGISMPFPGLPGPASVQLTGGLPRAYWVTKDNGKAMKLRKGNYNKRHFKKLFGDCEYMNESFSRPFKFKEFPLHVLQYDRKCGGK